MDKWDRKIAHCSRLEVIKYCVNDYEWQALRLKLKGQSTVAKLEALAIWLKEHNYERSAEVQVDNYLGALKRGGQISATGEVLK